MVTLQSADGDTLEVEKEVALQLCPLIDKIETNQVVCLPYISRKIMSLVITHCKSGIDDEFFSQLDQLTLFNLIQAAHHLKIKSLMDQTCQTFVSRVKELSSSAIMQKCNINHEYDQASKRLKRDPGSSRLRSHRREAFINRSEGLDVCHFHLDCVVKMNALFSHTKDPNLDYHVAKFLDYSDFLLMEDCLKRIENLCSIPRPKPRSFVHFSSNIDPPISAAIEKLRTTIKHIHVICEDQGSADLLSSEVARRLVLILDNIKFFDIEYMTADILSRVSFDKCGDVIKEAVPVLLKAVCSDFNQVAAPAAFTLARLAFASSKGINVSHFQAVRNALTKHKNGEAKMHLVLFLVFVCRGHDLSSSDKVKVVLPILEDRFFSIQGNSFGHTSMMRACYALSYLTYATPVVVKDQTYRKLVDLTSHTSISLAGSALGVVGNIVRWGSPQQIKYLVKDCKLMQCLGDKVLYSRFEKFRMEGCQIISNIAARIEFFIKDIYDAGLKDLLCQLLETAESNVKMEAAWAMFNMHYNDKYKHEHIDNYEEDTGMINVSEMNLEEVEHERSRLITSDQSYHQYD